MEVFTGLLHTSITGGIGVLMFGIFQRIFREKCRAKSRKIGWILIAVYMILPFHLPKLESAYTLEIPDVVVREQDAAEIYGNALPAENIEVGMNMPTLVKSGLKITINDVLLICWISVIVLLSTYYLTGYWVTKRRNVRRSIVCEDENIINAMAKLAEEIPLKRLPCLRIMTHDGEGPHTMGLMKKIIFLPDNISADKNLEYILKHEMTHCRENDNFWKLFFLAVNVIHWFNPLVWLMRKMADQDMELVCDESVTRNASLTERKEYGNMLIACLEGCSNGKHGNAFSADYAAGKYFMKRRFDYIFDCSPKWSGKVMVGILAVALFAVSSMTGIKVSQGASLRQDIPIENLWDMVDSGNDNILRFVTGLEIILPESWSGKIITETDWGPVHAPTSNTLVICERTNAEEGVGGDLFYLCFDLYRDGYDLVITGTVLGLYEHNGQQYVLTLAMPGSLCYVEGDEERKAAYEELSNEVKSVRINVDQMQIFFQCGIDDLEWVHDWSWVQSY